MAHGLNSVLKRGPGAIGSSKSEGKSGIGSRRIFAPHFKLQVLDSYRHDADCKGNQRATARKYGIHRRQIQKWLQCENNLRNSVGKSKVVSAAPEARKCGAELSLRSGQHRQRDDLCNDVYSQSPSVEIHVHCQDAYSQSVTNSDVINANDAYDLPTELGSEARVPSLILAPLDYTTHSRSQSVSPIDSGSPIDLSLKRPISLMEVSAPVCCPLSPQASRIPSPSCLVPFIQPHPDIWDLSTRNEVENTTDVRFPPHVESPPIENPPKPVKLFKPYLDDLRDEAEDIKAEPNIQPCCNRFVSSLPESEPTFCNNNYITPDYTYSLYELQPKNTINYYYTINKNYLYSPECENLPFCAAYENTVMLPQHSPPLKQRQSYSVDFKLSAIECYYQDTICRGNQRAVANKYNIHRRQVQKWLKQEDELRNRNDFARNVHIVR